MPPKATVDDGDLFSAFDEIDAALDGEVLPPVKIVEDDDDPITRDELADPWINPDREWSSLLDRNQEGGVLSTLPNLQIIVRNDDRLFGRLGFNLHQQCVVFVREPGRLRKKARDGKPILALDGPIWTLPEPAQSFNGRRWTDDHEFALRWVVEAPRTQGGYQIKASDRDIRGAINIVAHQNEFHPIRDRLRSFAWDGKPRAETLFIDYLGSPDDPYHRSAARLMLLGAVARVFEPGHKFDFVAILEGSQGAGKSTFIRILGLDWAGELAVDFKDNNRVIEAIQGGWILELPELQGFSKAETTTLKVVISRTHDKGRLAWERNVREFPRQCIFIGSTNEDDYLRDATGGRRFWPIKVEVESIDTARLRGEIEQVWAEVMTWYDALRAGQPFRVHRLPLVNP